MHDALRRSRYEIRGSDSANRQIDEGAAAVEINRNQWFMMGLVVLFLGVQLRFVDSYVLSEETTKFLIERSNKSEVRSLGLLPAAGPSVRKVVHPPEWLGWALMSVGSVLILHSLAMPRPA